MINVWSKYSYWFDITHTYIKISYVPHSIWTNMCQWKTLKEHYFEKLTAHNYFKNTAFKLFYFLPSGWRKRKYPILELGVVPHAYNPCNPSNPCNLSAWEAEATGSEVPGQLGLQSKLKASLSYILASNF
jgi:hypothetical protein